MNVCAMPVAHAVTATMRAGRPSTVRSDAAATRLLRRAARGGCGRGIALADRVAHDRDDVFVRLRRAKAAGEVVLHEAPRELGQHREVRLGRALGRGDEEDEIGGTVGGAEVDPGIESREGERCLRDGGALGVRNGDAAGQAGLVLLLARPRVGEERVGVGRSSLRDDARREGADDGRLARAETDVETDELRGDGVGHGDLQVVGVVRVQVSR